MIPAALRRAGVAVKQWIHRSMEKINHEAVTKDIVQEVDISAGYFLTLVAASLIALSGLITNSAPVIIGAMLISPLMGPILSLGFAFTTGHRQIWRLSVRKILISVVLTIIVAALASAVSPLREITQEIVSRTRPNLYDLIVAFIAGSAGASALCTKRNYLTIVPGVAIATAVIPPLSVAGFGAGTGNFNILLGGFFLFFTNFVAIIIATSAIFYFYGFRPPTATEPDVSRLRKRMAFLAALLVVISIPLVYTLHASVSEITTRRILARELRNGFDREKRSQLTSFDYTKKKDVIDVNAVINTIYYLDDADISGVEKQVSGALGRTVRLNVNQVKVQPGGLKKVVVQVPTPAIAPPRPSPEVIRTSRENVMSAVRQSVAKVEKVLSPSALADFTVGFDDKSSTVTLSIKLRCDKKVTSEERFILRRMIESELDLPVILSIETEPLVAPLVFSRDSTSLTKEMHDRLSVIGDIFKRDHAIRCRISAAPEQGLTDQQQRSLSHRRIDIVEQVLVREYGMSRQDIETVISKKAGPLPQIRVTVLPKSIE